MHVYFSGIGGTGIGPLALIAKQAGYEVSGSDAKESAYTDYLKSSGISDITIGQTAEQISKAHSKKPIDWFVYSSALPLTNPHHPELKFCEENGIRATRRDEFLANFITDRGLKLVAVAGTHGKTTTTSMLIWLAKHLGLKAGWSVGAKLEFAEMGHFEPDAEYFLYEADEFDRNFLSFYPHIALITGLDWDHPDIYPTRQSYLAAFQEFIEQSEQTVLWREDAEKLSLKAGKKHLILDDEDPAIERDIKLPGRVNRLDAWLVARTLAQLPSCSLEQNLKVLNSFPGLSRRFERLAENIYTDYAHTPPKIRGALQTAEESAGNDVVVVYEGLHNTRQHFIKDELKNLFDEVEHLYIVPSYLARENTEQELLTPVKILNLLSNSARQHSEPAKLDDSLLTKIKRHAKDGKLVLCLSAGGAGSLDEWLRKSL